MKTGTATLENSMELPQKVKNRATLRSSNYSTRYLPKEYKNSNLKGYMHPNVYSSNVHNSQTMERAQVSTNKWMHKDVVQGACVAQSVSCLPWVQVMIPGSGAGMKPHIRLHAQQGVCFSFSLCPSLHSFSLSLLNKQMKSSENNLKKNMWCRYAMECYSVMKENEISPFAMTWMEPEGIRLSEMSQSQKDNSMISLICGI